MTPEFIKIRTQHHFCDIYVTKCVSIDYNIYCAPQLPGCFDSREHQCSVLQVHFVIMYPSAILDYAPEHLHSEL